MHNPNAVILEIHEIAVQIEYIQATLFIDDTELIEIINELLTSINQNRNAEETLLERNNEMKKRLKGDAIYHDNRFWQCLLEIGQFFLSKIRALGLYEFNQHHHLIADHYIKRDLLYLLIEKGAYQWE